MANLPAVLVFPDIDIDELFDRIDGNLYEEQAANRVLTRASFLGIERAHIAYSKAGQVPQEFYEAMAMAVQTDLISRDEYTDLTEADLIVCGSNRCHMAVEISLRPNGEDISSAVRRSRSSRGPPANKSPQSWPRPTPIRSSSKRRKQGTYRSSTYPSEPEKPGLSRVLTFSENVLV